THPDRSHRGRRRSPPVPSRTGRTVARRALPRGRTRADLRFHETRRRSRRCRLRRGRQGRTHLRHPGEHMNVVQRLEELRARTDRIDPRELDALWEHLAPARIDDLVGYRWKGFSFDTGHRTHTLLGRSRWYGKTFVSASEVQPLVCYGE